MNTFLKVSMSALILATLFVGLSADANAGTKPSTKRLSDKAINKALSIRLKGKDEKKELPKLLKQFKKDIETVTKKIQLAAAAGDLSNLDGYNNTLHNLGKAIKEISKRMKGGVVLLGIPDAGIAK